MNSHQRRIYNRRNNRSFNRYIEYMRDNIHKTIMKLLSSKSRPTAFNDAEWEMLQQKHLLKST